MQIPGNQWNIHPTHTLSKARLTIFPRRSKHSYSISTQLLVYLSTDLGSVQWSVDHYVDWLLICDRAGRSARGKIESFAIFRFKYFVCFWLTTMNLMEYPKGVLATIHLKALSSFQSVPISAPSHWSKQVRNIFAIEGVSVSCFRFQMGKRNANWGLRRWTLKIDRNSIPWINNDL